VNTANDFRHVKVKLGANMSLEVKNVTKIYFPGKPNEVRALDGVSFTLPKGAITALTGPSGCGKTTLLSILATFEKPSSGQTFFDGRETTLFSDAALSDLRRNHIGFVFQHFNLLSNLMAWENVAYPLTPLGMPWQERRSRAEELLRQFGLDGRFEHVPEQLSGGEQQRVALARALIFSPDIIIADEPSSNIDVESIERLKKFFTDMRAQGKTVLFSTHETSLLEIADHRIKLQRGKIVSQ
jgi:ABC-type lipoprotein export system ATPase subunit